MAITAPTTLSGFSGFLSPEMSKGIFDEARKRSVVQLLSRKVPLGPTGKSIPVTTGKMSAGWVAEGAMKPASAGTLSLKTITPKKLAAIAVVSAEVVRADPGGFMGTIRDDMAEAFAIAFDAAALHGTSTPFTTYIDQTTNAVELGTTSQANGGIYGDINAGLSLLVNAGKKLTGFAMDDRMEPLLNAAVDLNGRPIFVDSPLIETAGPVRAGRLLGRPAFIGEGIYKAAGVLLGYGGDFYGQSVWGSVGGISYSVSTEATVTIDGALVSLWQNNLVAVLGEAEYGWLVNDVQSFVKYANATP